MKFLKKLVYGRIQLSFILIIFLSFDCWAMTELLRVTTTYPGMYPSMPAIGMDTDGPCDDISLYFNVRKWEQLDPNHVFVSFGDEKEYIFFGGPGHLRYALSENINESAITVIGPAFIAKISGDTIYLCLSDQFRLAVMYSMAQKEIEDTIDGAMIPEDEIKMMLASGIIVTGAYVGVSIAFMPAYIAAYSGVELTKRTIALNTMKKFADLADEHITKNIFLWYTGSIGEGDSSQLDLTDYDNDGYFGATLDCNDNDPTIYPGAFDWCDDGIDQDCSGEDEECLFYGPNFPSNPDGSEPDITPDLHITSVKGGLSSEDYDDMNHSITETLFPGQCVKTSFIARYVNEADQEAKDVDFDWRADQDRSRFDEDDDKLCDENREDVDAGEKNKKTFNNANLCVSSDGKRLTLTGPDGSISSAFQFDNEKQAKVAKIYVFADVEEKGRDNGDHDISSESKRDEYVKIEVTFGEDPAQGWVSISNNPLISPQPIILGKDFNITVFLKETKGLPKTFDKVAFAILNPDGSLAFDFAMYDNISIAANGTWTKTATNYLYDSRPPGTYQVMVRGNIGGGSDGWFDFDTTGSGVNPAYFNTYRMGDEPPTAPSNLQSVTVTKNSIDLSWTDNSNNEKGFIVRRSLDGSSWTNIATLGVNATSYSDASLSANTTHYYQVKAYNDSGNSAWSATASAKPLSADQKPLIISVWASNIKRTGATLNVTINPGGKSTSLYFDYGLTTGYGKIANGGNVGSGSANVSAGANINGLVCNKIYHFRARAANSIGETYSADKTFTTSPCLSSVNPKAIVSILPLLLSDSENKNCFRNLPKPIIIQTEAERYDPSGGPGVQYSFSVENNDQFPKALFEPAPHLPPCGINNNASRTWLGIFDNNNNYLYGFCALNVLDSFWFAVSDSKETPSSIYLELWDRECDIFYKSNLLNVQPLE